MGFLGEPLASSSLSLATAASELLPSGLCGSSARSWSEEGERDLVSISELERRRLAAEGESSAELRRGGVGEPGSAVGGGEREDDDEVDNMEARASPSSLYSALEKESASLGACWVPRSESASSAAKLYGSAEGLAES